MTTRPESTDTDARTSRLRELIRGVYQRQNPSKLNDLDVLFKKYLGSEVNLYKALCLKYRLQPDALAVEGSTTASAPAVLGDASRGSPSSGQGSVGVLLLLRWPSNTPRHMAPDVLQQAWEVPPKDKQEQTVYALLPEGTSRSDWDATQAAASVVVHLLVLSNVPRVLDAALSAACANGPLLCRYQEGSPRSAATWARLEAPQLPADRPATVGDLQDAGAFGVLEALRSCAQTLRATCIGEAHKSMRKRLNNVRKDAERALASAHDPASCSSGLATSVGAARLLSQYVSTDETLGPFAAVLRRGGAEQQPPMLRPGFGDAEMPTARALHLLLGHWVHRAMSALQRGPVSYPRRGHLCPRTSAKQACTRTRGGGVYALHCTAPRRTALHCIAQHCTALHSAALQCTALHCAALQALKLPWRQHGRPSGPAAISSSR